VAGKAMNVRLVALSEPARSTVSNNASNKIPDNNQHDKKHDKTVKSYDTPVTNKKTQKLQLPIKQQHARAIDVENKVASFTISDTSAEKKLSTINEVTTSPIDQPVNVAEFEKNDALNKKLVLQYLQGELSRHFSYPRLARLRGWQGKVLLGFKLQKSGTIENIYIAKSSGYALLDNAASQSLAKIKHITDTDSRFKSWLDNNASNLQLPVIYRLQEG
jgi:TonB family protein